MSKFITTNDYAPSILESIDPITKGIAWGIAKAVVEQGIDQETAVNAKLTEWGQGGKSVTPKHERGFRWAVGYYIDNYATLKTDELFLSNAQAVVDREIAARLAS